MIQTVEEYLESKRCQLSIDESISRWVEKYQQDSRSEIAPDGFPYNVSGKVWRAKKKLASGS